MHNSKKNFTFQKKEWKEVKMPYSEEFISVEKDTIRTAFFQPKTIPKATILFFHGASGNISTYMHMIEVMVENEYQVYAADSRYYGKFTGKPTHLNVLKDVECIR